ncbi:subunit 17 of mediator complex-domain-containing protein [Pseudomassariella vexata]|uniref:Mediator of RNA polymerase II transcription subunit 17 n=1 Tax=Pseudomassariella vexata TaxID=1141098 RepID=A0A1Y2DMR0_9PEZI|nr:subunit 17 of mediator complex-domain-containing protein [Pseudomassariella vexata]ORY60552.1 subunit 17 of mediator complex-domain-containing protein [Pseudomassariella vexata]
MASPFSLRPWPMGDKKPKNLGEFIARVNAEHESFRHVTEAQLREELAAQTDGRLDNGSLEGNSESDSDSETDKTKNVLAARDEILRSIDSAHQDSLMCLDFISLLLTKESPVTAGVSLRPEMRDMVGIGTLGATKTKDSNVTEARKNDNLAVAAGWRVMGINKMVDSVVAAAERLEKEITLETKYWADILAVSENGWAVSALPQDPHTLGVRFGFSEAATEYRDNSIAPLRRNDDGTVRLAHGRVGAGSQRVRVVIERNNEVIGRSSLPRRTPDNAPLQDRVLEARNTIFAQELWHEINREARTLLSLGVRSDESSVTCAVDANTKAIFTLEDLGEEALVETLPEDETAEAVTLALCFCLCHSHRQNYNRRSRVSQSAQSRDPYSILRHIITRFRYNAACSALTCFLSGLVETLNRAGVSTASCTDSIPPASSQLKMQGPWRTSKCEALLGNVMYNLEITAELTTTPEARIFIRGKSFIEPYVSMPFQIRLIGPPAQSQDQPQDSVNPLHKSYPPVDKDPYYPNVDDAIHYIRQATIRALTEKFAKVASERLQRDDIDWDETTNGVAIMDRFDREARIDLLGSTTPVLHLRFEWPSDNNDNNSSEHSWEARDRDSQDLDQIEGLIVQFFRTEKFEGNV